jgi:CubicO group peptidase (beta-lactamase class C family)
LIEERDEERQQDGHAQAWRPEAARFGLLVARQGRCADRRILSEAWIKNMLSPSPTNRSYGYLWWLNRGAARYPSAPADSVFAMGAGSNIIWIDPVHDLVAVLRWIDKTAVDGFFARVLRAVRQ